MSVMQDLRNGMSIQYDCCNLCGQPITAGKWVDGKMVKSYVKMTVYGRSETRKVHIDCIRKYTAVDNTEIFNSTRIRKNGIINFAKIRISANDVMTLKAYMVSCGYTYIWSNQSSAEFISPKFSGFSSFSKMIKNAPKKIDGFKICNVDIYDANDMRTANVYMSNGINTDYTEVGRLFNKNTEKSLKEMSEYIKAHN
jgi:hypothetical protein